MFKQTIAFLLTLGAVAPALARPFGDGFSSGALVDYLDEPRKVAAEQVAMVQAKGAEGRNVLRVAQAAQVSFKRVPVDQDTKYTLAFRARYEGWETAEENPYLDMFTARQVPPGFPRREIRFFDAQMKPIPGAIVSGMPFGQWQEYRETFYPPSGAAFMQLVVHPGRREITFFLDNATFEKTPDEGAINVNPVIGKYGKYNYSGWAGLATAAKIVEDSHGRIVFDTKYGTRGFSFPLSGPGTYAITAKSENNGYNCSIVLDLLDEKGKKVNGVSAWGNGRPYPFVVPDNVKRGSFLIYSNLVEEIRVTRVVDAAASGK